jgi:Carboxypeptidase regulatory-like domain
MNKKVWSKRSGMGSVMAYFIVSVGLVLTSIGARAQNITGTITGTVTDQNRAVLPNVQVNIKNDGTGLTRTVTTDDQGNYIAPLLPVGNYTISAERQGFRKKAATGIALQVDQTARVDLILEVGSLSDEIINIAGGASLTNTETSQVGEVIDNRRMVDLPLNGRQFLQLALLNSGASTTSGSFDTNLQITGPRVIMNGQMEQYNNYTVDGTDATDPFYRTLSISPSVDAIQEFKILTNNYAAEFGNFTGAMVNISIKAGSNGFHGTAYEFLRNEKLDAKNFFDDPNMPTPPFKQNQFGATLGGPVIKNKTFFFGSYEGFRQRKALTSRAQVPSDRMRQGDLSELTAPRPSGLGQPRPVDPITGQFFPNDVIPLSRFNPVATALLDLLPHTTGGINYILSRSQKIDDDQFHIRADHQFSSKNNFFARFSFDNLDTLQPGLVPTFDQKVTSFSRNLSLSDTHVFSTRLINEFRFGFNRTAGGQELAVKGLDFAGPVGLQGVTTDPNKQGVPSFTISTFATVYGQPLSVLSRRDNTFQYVDNLTYTRGNHNLKFGGLFTRYQFNPQSDNRARGTFTYDGTLTKNAYSDFLLGLPNISQVGIGDVTMHGRSYLLAAYAQDDWKVTTRLTINLGLRYEYLAPVTDTDGLISTLDLRDISHPRFVATNTDPQNFAPGVAGRFPLPLVSAEDAGLPSSLVIPTKGMFAPRFGFAWRPFDNDKTVVRGGYGIFYAHPSFNWPFQLKFNLPWLDLKLITNTAGVDVRNVLLAPAVGNTSAFAVDPNFRIGYSQQWFLNIQRAITPDLLVEVSYIGNKGIRLMEVVSPNQPPPGPGPQAPRRPIPQLGIFGYNQSRGRSNYHAMQWRLEKRATRGLVLTAQYTFAKSLGTNSTLNGSISEFPRPQNSNNIDGDYGLSAFDHKHRFTANFVYLLPIGPGMRFLGSTQGFLGKLLEGWQTTGIITLQDGVPITIRDGIDRSNTGEGADRPDQIGNPELPKSERTVQRYFNTGAFQLQAINTFGSAGRNTVRGPAFSNFDFSLIKSTKITESHRLEFRAEFFNIFNHPNFNIPDRTLTSATFGQINAAFTPRDIQFGLKYIF